MTIIYIITNLINEKIYIGQTSRNIQRRFKEHGFASEKGCVRIYNAMQKYGIHNFKIETVKIVETQEEADQEEIFWISEMRNYLDNKMVYNIRSGGSHGLMTDEAKRKMSISHTGLKQTAKHIANRAAKRLGYKTSKETKQKMSQSALGKLKSEETKRKMSLAKIGSRGNNTGHKHSEETKAKMSLNKGMTWKLIDGKRVWFEKVG
jgi:group I intron endonuclease